MKKIIFTLILAMSTSACAYKLPTYDTSHGALPVNETQYYSSEDLQNVPQIEKGSNE